MELAELEARITHIEDVEAIKKLKAQYCEICDDMHNPDRVTSVFVEDGIWESEDFGLAKGHAEIKDLFQKFQDMFSFSQHNISNPIIDVNGDAATAIWYLSGPWTFTENGDEKWFAIRYDDDYVKVNGEWKYKHLRASLRMTAERQT
ncbi:MAG: nuclear transport factor 2 family protein [Pseudomonadota bacterium]